LTAAYIWLGLAQIGNAQTFTYSTLYSFPGGSAGAGPYAGITLGDHGALYGTTEVGGTWGTGVVFMLEPTRSGWNETVLHTFTSYKEGSGGTDGSYPVGDLVFDGPNVLYGTTWGGGQGAGTIFEMTRSADDEWSQQVIYGFDAERHSGNHSPRSTVYVAPTGTLYATAFSGSVVAVDSPKSSGDAWTGSVIYTPGGQPLAGVILHNGALYGTTYSGGNINCDAGGCGGSAYQLSPPTAPGGPWIGVTIYNFGAIPTNGAGPEAPLAVAPKGAFYGTTFYGGTSVLCNDYDGFLVSGCGTVFQLTAPSEPGGTWTQEVVHNFQGTNGDGAYPTGPLLVDANGVLYGTTQYGGDPTSPCSYYGAAGCGIVFSLTPPAEAGGTWTETILHSFTGENGDGAIPTAGLTIDANGNLYGTTFDGGSSDSGSVFVLKPQ
jgi:uncharacterized repeat protein (TIGR03803 family)